MRWVIFKCVRVLVAAIGLGLFFAANTSAWAPGVSPEFTSSNVKVSDPYPCPGSYGTVDVSGEGLASACIMGINTRVASYFPSYGGIAYAVSFPFENTFYPLDVCSGVFGCVYAEQSDTFVGSSGVYKQFAKNLKRLTFGDAVFYSPNVNSTVLSVKEFAGKTYSPETYAISQNGKWALVELKTYGILRINVQTSEVRRISAPGVSYGYGSDPRIEMAISNDGTGVATVGLRMGVRLIVVNETCGDTLTAFTQRLYDNAVASCGELNTPTSTYTPGFLHATRPLFSSNSKVLAFDVHSIIADPRHITLYADSKPDSNGLHYLALGDSFTSGEGETDDTYYLGGAANKCHVSRRSYPFLLANSWDVSINSAACSGATIQTARGQSGRASQTAQLTELESQAPDIATIGLGGNDAGLIGKLKDCLGVDTCKWASTDADRRSTALEIKSLYPRLKQFYLDTKTKTLGAVIAVGYPRIVTDQSSCASTVGLLLDQTERKFMNEAIHYLNQVMQAAAIDVGIEYADIETALAGGELCSVAESSLMNAIRLGDDFPNIAALPSVKIIGAESFHPKPAGHAKVAETIFQKFPDLNAINTRINYGQYTPVPAPGSYWDASSSSKKPQQAIPFLNKITIKKKDLFEISLPAFSFKPSSDIVLELHSEVRSLGTVQSADDGSLNVTIHSEGFEPGFHSVHAIGKNFAGNDVDTYDFLTVEDDAIATAATPAAGGSVPSVSIAQHSKPQLTPSLTSNEAGAPLGVLGSAIENSSPIKNSETVYGTTGEAAKQSQLNPSNRYKGFIVASLILVLAVIAVALYVYNRQKMAQ